jgi:hypothetical protein
VLSDVSGHGEVDCRIVEEAITKQHVISNRALGVNLGRKKTEEVMLSLMGPLVRNTAHPVMVDNGANVSYLSVQALKQFRQLRSFMFEPTPSTCVILLQSMIDNGVEWQTAAFSHARLPPPPTARLESAPATCQPAMPSL